MGDIIMPSQGGPNSFLVRLYFFYRWIQKENGNARESTGKHVTKNSIHILTREHDESHLSRESVFR